MHIGKIKYVVVLLLAVLILTSLVDYRHSKDSEPFLISYPPQFGGRFKIPEANPMTREGVLLGRYLFYEPRLSKNNSISCASCHQQEKAFTDGRSLSEGVDGLLSDRNSMSLANLLWVRNFFWDGRAKGLEEQAEFPLTAPHEMAQSLEESVEKLGELPLYQNLFRGAFGDSGISGEGIVKALAQFERTLISADSPYDAYLAGTYSLTDQELRGMLLFMDNPGTGNRTRGTNCAHCHGGPKMFKELFHDNGLDRIPGDLGKGAISGREEDKGRFRVPTLRNIALTAPYMHDGRFESLEEVLDHYSEHVQDSPNLSPFISSMGNKLENRQLFLTAEEKKDLLAFLHTLTDSNFIRNPEFSNPHVP